MPLKASVGGVIALAVLAAGCSGQIGMEPLRTPFLAGAVIGSAWEPR